MDWQTWSLVGAGVIGAAVALIHGALVQRLMVTPIDALLGTDARAGVTRRLNPALLQFSTFNWFVGGIALIVAALWLDGPTRLAVALLVGSSYLYGAVFNLWATRGRHPGWALYGIAVTLIVFGVS